MKKTWNKYSRIHMEKTFYFLSNQDISKRSQHTVLLENTNTKGMSETQSQVAHSKKMKQTWEKTQVRRFKYIYFTENG